MPTDGENERKRRKPDELMNTEAMNTEESPKKRRRVTGHNNYFSSLYQQPSSQKLPNQTSYDPRKLQIMHYANYQEQVQRINWK